MADVVQEAVTGAEPERAERAAARSGSRFPCFDGLRGLAALSVLLFHVGEFVAVRNAFAASVIVRLDQGVSVFFVLSGFLLSRPFIEAHAARRPGPRVAGFARRRILRIYPAYWCALLLSVYVLDQGVLHGAAAKVEHLALVQTYFTWPHGTALTPSWTLVVEVSFYAMLPVYAALLALVERRLRSVTPLAVELGGAVVLLVGGTLVQLVYSWGGNVPVWARILPLYLPMFAWGMLLAVASVWISTRPIVPRPFAWVGAHPVVGWATGAAAFATMVALVRRTSPLALQHYQVASLLVLGGVLGLGLVTPAAFGNQDVGRGRRVLRSRPVAFLGTVSYGFYLWHLTLIAKIDPHFTYQHLSGFLTLTALAVLASLAVATVSWYVVERPLIAWSRRVPRRRRPRSPLAALPRS